MPYQEARIFDDAKKMSETKFALRQFFNDDQIDVIWRVASGCLWMGNIEYSGDCERPDVDKTGASAKALNMVSELWQVDKDKLENACHIETLTIQKKLTVCPRCLTVSRALRDSMARAVYDGLFVWMIEQMSGVLATKTGMMNEQQPFIGILDIFGFEFYTDEALMPLGGQASDVNALLACAASLCC